MYSSSILKMPVNYLAKDCPLYFKMLLSTDPNLMRVLGLFKIPVLNWCSAKSGNIFAHDLAGIFKTCTNRMFILDYFANINTSFHPFCLKIGTHIVFDTSKVRAKGFLVQRISRDVAPVRILARLISRKRCRTKFFGTNLGTIVTNLCTNFHKDSMVETKVSILVKK